MLSTKSKILLRISGTPHSFVDYDIAYKYPTSPTQVAENHLYYGNGFIDSTGYAQIQVDDILREAGWKLRYDYDVYDSSSTTFDNPHYTPKEKLSSMTAPFYPLENIDTFFCTNAEILWGDMTAMPKRMRIPVCAFDDPRNIELPIGSDEVGVYHGQLIRIPNVQTEKMYFIFNFFKGEDNEDDIILHYDQNGTDTSVQLDPQWYGSYCYCVDTYMMLKTLANNPDIYIEFGDRALKKIGEIDICPKKYYVIWQDSDGSVNSFGFDGNTTKTMSNEKTEISGLNSDRVFLGGMQTDTYNIVSEYVSKDIYNKLAGMTNSEYVYLYDTATDEGFLCTLDNATTTQSAEKLYSFSASLERKDKIMN